MRAGHNGRIAIGRSRPGGAANRSFIMTTVQIQLPDELAQDAQAAGLLAPEAIEAMLREQLRKQAGETLQAMWARMPHEELTPEIEQMIDEEVQAVRAAQRKLSAG
jgi:post-segregation antitoxin (ccd killing protein)